MATKIRSIKLMWYCKTPRGWRRFPAIIETVHGSKQARLGWVKDQGREVEYPDGRFELRRFENKRKVYTRVLETNPRDAYLARERAWKAARNVADPMNNLAVLRTAGKAYMDDCVRRGASEAAEQAELVLKEFLPLCNVTYVRGIDRKMVLDYHVKLRANGISERTIANKHQRVKAFLKFCKVDTAFLPAAPKFELKEPTIYTPQEIKSIRDAGDEYMKLVIDMGLKLGLREQELMFSAWSDLDEHHAVFRVTSKPLRGFTIKDKQQREVPVPADLLSSLRAWHTTRPKSTLILGNRKDKPSRHLLRRLKRLAKKAGLNCEKCIGCKGHLGECREWSLHRFRRTYLTTLLRQNIDARTVMGFAGHSNLTTTLRYLKSASAPELQAKINKIKFGD